MTRDAFQPARDTASAFWRPEIGDWILQLYKYGDASSSENISWAFFSLLLPSFLPLSFFSFTPGEKTTTPRGHEKEGIFSLQDLRRPSIDERANESAELQGVFQFESLENRRWRRRECPPYLFCRPFLPRAGRSRARTRLIFKVPDEWNESRVSRFKLVLSILRPAGLLILRYC